MESAMELRSRIGVDEIRLAQVAFWSPSLEQREITVMFRESFRRLPDLEITSEPAYLASLFFNGIKHMSCALTPRRMAGQSQPR